MTSTAAELRSLFHTVGLDPASTSLLTETGPTAALPSVFDVTTSAATAVAASTLAASLRASQTGDSPPEPVAVDRRHAALSFRAERFLRVGDEDPPSLWDPLAGYYQDQDGSWIQLHTNFEHHRDAVLPEPVYQAKEQGDLPVGQRGGGLIQNNNIICTI